MKAVLALSTLIALAFASPLPTQEEAIPRQFYPEENDLYRIRYLPYEDEDGNILYEDLTVEHDLIRAGASDVTFYLYTQRNTQTPSVIPGTNFAAVANTQFSSNRKTIVVSHGWNNHHQSPVNTYVRNALLQVADVNLIVLDWSGIANRFYTTARAAVRNIGEVEGDFVQYLIDTYRLTPDDFILIGHSLGAHVAGCAGARLNGQVSTIIGLDPAGPLFTINNIDNRIDPTDGKTVHIIHTNGGLLGFGSSIGHADYYPNGGRSQPGCGLDLAGTCAHSRAYMYLAESFTHSGFISVLCDSYSNFSRGRCSSNARSILGELSVDRSANGDYFLDTASSSLYALGENF